MLGYLRDPARLFVRLKPSRLRRAFLHRPAEWPGFDGVPRVVWMYWHSGEDTAPELVRRCIASWREMNPGWEVVVLDEATVDRFADLGDLRQVRPIAHVTDILRTRLLAGHGGVWADATLWCAIPLDLWLPPLLGQGLFLFSTPGPDRLVANWFMAARTGHPAFRRLDDRVARYWAGREGEPIYFWHHYLIEYLARTDGETRRALAGMPKVSADGPHRLQRFLSAAPATLDELPDLTGIPVHKLSWKLPLDPGLLYAALEGSGAGRRATQSTSTSAPTASAVTPTVVRAGRRSSGK